MFNGLQGDLLLNVTLLCVKPVINSAVIQVSCYVVWESECGGRNVLFCGWHNVTARGNMLLQRRCNKCESRSAQQKARKLTTTPVAPRENPARVHKPGRNLCCLSLPRFSTPAPVSTPQEPRVWAGWGDLGDSRGGKRDLGHTANTSRSVYLLNPGQDGTPPKKPTIALTYRPFGVYFLCLPGC